MIPEDLEALALADSVGALDADEQAQLAARRAQLSPEEQAQLARLYETATAMATAVDSVQPPARVRDRVLAAAHAPARYTVPGGDADWSESGLPGIRIKVLAVDKRRSLATLLIRADPGAVYPSHRHHGPEECLVLRGSVIIDGRVLRAGDFHHADEDSDHAEITTIEGAEVLVVGAIEDYLPAQLASP